MSAAPTTHNVPSIAGGVVARFAQIALVFVLQGLILFLAAGRLDWTWAWLYLALCVAMVAINATFLKQEHLKLIAERGRAVSHMRDWDKVVSGLWGLCQYAAVPLVAALDVRFGWSGDISPIVHLVGAVVLASGLALFSWAMIVNAYFSTAAQIQSGQTVCRAGPYRVVRHPGYAGAILQSLGIAVLLGSWWALVPAAGAALCMVLRTVLEDRMLRAELDGYEAYVHDVPSRLMPGLW